MHLNQVTLPSTDVRRSIDFYRRLGLIQIVEEMPTYARFECPDGDATLSVEQVGERPATPGIVICFECEDVDSSVRQLREQCIQFDSDPRD